MSALLPLARRWLRYATASSYYHLPQGRGRIFDPTRLAGYFNDLTGKIEWRERTDEHGVPVHVDARGREFQFPITIAQKGLGHWDRWLLSGMRADAHLAAACALANWLVADQDANGGWRCWDRMRAVTVSPYSAMAQGQGISLLIRLHAATGTMRYAEAADQACRFLLETEGEDSVRRDFHGMQLLEEYPKREPNGVLNGWIFAAFGLHDHALATRRLDVRAIADEVFRSIDACLVLYDTGAWSAYDLNGRIASPFYHDLHIAQLAALVETYPAGVGVRNALARFRAYRRSPVRLARAVAAKVQQKLREKEYEVLA